MLVIQKFRSLFSLFNLFNQLHTTVRVQSQRVEKKIMDRRIFYSFNMPNYNSKIIRSGFLTKVWLQRQNKSSKNSQYLRNNPCTQKCNVLSQLDQKLSGNRIMFSHHLQFWMFISINEALTVKLVCVHFLNEN